MKNKFILAFLIFFSSLQIFAVSSQIEKNFIKASLAEKITIVKNLKEKDLVSVTQKALDFSIENSSVLKDDKDLTNLALACVLVLPSDAESIKSLKNSDLQQISEKFMTIFKLFKNPDLRRAIMKNLELYSGNDQSLTVLFLNDYLASAYKANENEENVLEEAITTIGKIGDNESLSIIYNIWVSKIWDKYHEAIDDALVSLSRDSFGDAIRILSSSKIEDSAHYFKILKKSDKISENSLCQIAENALLIAINNVENLSAKSEDSEKAFIGFQLDTQEVLTEHKWSHAASAINRNLLLAKKAYAKGTMGEKDFVRLIKSSVQIPSHDLAQSLTDMLSECNRKVENASSDAKVEMPAKSVVLALITALGELGDKTAFDTLLSVTYLSYPLEVVDEAKKSLQALNW